MSRKYSKGQLVWVRGYLVEGQFQPCDYAECSSCQEKKQEYIVGINNKTNYYIIKFRAGWGYISDHDFDVNLIDKDKDRFWSIPEECISFLDENFTNKIHNKIDGQFCHFCGNFSPMSENNFTKNGEKIFSCFSCRGTKMWLILDQGWILNV